jgi:hypothetical protein
MVFPVYGFLNGLPNDLNMTISCGKNSIQKNLLCCFCGVFDVDLNGIL